MKTITITIKLPMQNSVFTQKHANVIERAAALFTSQFLDFTPLIKVELTADVLHSDMNLEINPPNIKMQSIIWAFIYRSMIAITTPISIGKDAKLNAVVLLPEEWGVQKCVNFYDKFTSCITDAYPKISIESILIQPTSAIVGDVVLPTLLNISMHQAEEMEYAIKRIGYMLYKGEINAQNI